MFQRRSSRLSLLLCGLLAAAAWFPLPLPAGWEPAVFQDLEWEHGVLRIRWEDPVLRLGTGRVEARNLRVEVDGVERLRASRIVARFSLPSLLRGRLRLGRLLVDAPRLDLDRRLLEKLLEAQPDPETPRLPELPLQILNGRLHYRDEGLERDLVLELPMATAKHGSDGLRLRAVLALPGGLDLRLWLRSQPQSGAAELTVDAQAPRGLDLRELPWASISELSARGFLARARFRRAAAGSPWKVRTRVEIKDGSLGFRNPSLRLEHLDLRAGGGLEKGIGLEGGFSCLEEDLTLQGRLSREAEGGLRLRVEGRAEELEVDDALVARIQALDPGAAEGIEGVEPRGRLPVRFALDWRPGEDPRWLAAGRLAGLRSTFRGYLEEDGDRPSFAWPVEVEEGDLVAAPFPGEGVRILIRVGGRMGEGSVQGRATVQVGGGPAGVSADLRVEDFHLDRRMTSAVAGTPALAAIWRDLGHPEGGPADVEILVRRPWGGEEVQVRLAGRVREARLRPVFLPIETRVPDLLLHWAPGEAVFSGDAEAAGARLFLQGRVREVAGEETPEILVRARARDGAPDAGERRILEAYLDLPAGTASLEVGGRHELGVAFRKPGGRAEAQVTVHWQAHGAMARWTPTGLRAKGLAGEAWVLRHGRQSLAACRSLEGLLQTAPARGSLSLLQTAEDSAPRGDAVLRLRDLEVGAAEAETVQRILFGPEGGSDRLTWSGSVDLALALPLADPGRPRGRAELQPLRVRERVAGTDEAVLLGPVLLQDGSLRAPYLQIQAEAGLLEVRDLRIQPLAPSSEAPPGLRTGIRIQGVLDSEQGIEIGERFAALVSEDAWAAIQRLGMRGCLGARNLALDLELPAGGGAQFTMNGEILPRHIRIQAPPRFEEGAAVFQVRDFRWRGPLDFGGQIRLLDGSARVGGLPLEKARAEVRLTPKDIFFEEFQASTLGGRVRTRPGEGETPPGVVRVGLTPEVPLRLEVEFEGVNLEEMREELDLGGSLAGTASGVLDLRSASVSPLDYQARGWFEITEGDLGTVPVLATLWRVVGIDPPRFSEVRVEWWTHPERNRGQIRVDSYVLQNPALLEVTGDGWIAMDGEIRMNARIRDLSVVGWLLELPLVVDLFDLLVEQNVGGTVERPRVVHRAADVLFSGPAVPARHPLWTPDPGLPDWRLSPVLPRALLPPRRERPGPVEDCRKAAAARP